MGNEAVSVVGMQVFRLNVLYLAMLYSWNLSLWLTTKLPAYIYWESCFISIILSIDLSAIYVHFGPQFLILSSLTAKKQKQKN